MSSSLSWLSLLSLARGMLGNVLNQSDCQCKKAREVSCDCTSRVKRKPRWRADGRVRVNRSREASSPPKLTTCAGKQTAGTTELLSAVPVDSRQLLLLGSQSLTHLLVSTRKGVAAANKPNGATCLSFCLWYGVVVSFLRLMDGWMDRPTRQSRNQSAH